jgi:hypothetical protein
MQRPRNETTAVAMQQRGKHASTTIQLLLETVLCNPLLGSCNSWAATMETGGVFYVVRAEEILKIEFRSCELRVQCSVGSRAVKRLVCVKWPPAWELVVS